MTTSEIENLSFAELKKRREELVTAAKDAPVDELAGRYIQARTDAKQRDEKMVEQGKTITELQLALEASREREQAVVKSRAREADSAAQAVATVNNLKEDVVRLGKDARVANARAARLKAEATRNQAALTGAAKLLNDAIAAQRLEDVDTGE